MNLREVRQINGHLMQSDIYLGRKKNVLKGRKQDEQTYHP